MAHVKLLLNEDDGDYCAVYVDDVYVMESWSGPTDPEQVIRSLVGVTIDSFETVETGLPFYDENGKELKKAAWPKKLK